MASDQKRPSVKHKRVARSTRSRNISPDSMTKRDAVLVNQDKADEADKALSAPDDSSTDGVAHTPEPLQAHEPSQTAKPLSGEMQSADPGTLQNPHDSHSSQEAFAEEPDDFFDLGEEVPHSQYSWASSSAKNQGGAFSKQASTRQHKAQKSQKEARKKAAKGSVRRVVLTVLCVLMAAALVGGGYCVWNTLLRYDDAADIQGEWRTEDGAMTVVIDESDIRMPDLEYSYEIDTLSKQITFSFSDLSGSGTYSFSEDRTQLTIVEGEGDSATTTVLIKVSDDTQADPQLLDDSSSSDAEDGEEGATSEDEIADESDTSEDTSETSDEDEA